MDTSILKKHHCKEFELMPLGNWIESGHSIKEIYFLKEGEDFLRKKFHNQWFASSNEYATPIIFCPFCGVKLMETIPYWKEYITNETE